MRTLIISTEGQSEDTFVNVALKPYLREFGVFVKSIIIGNGRAEKGGWAKLEELQKEISEILHSPEGKKTYVTVTSMYDFADIRSNFPDYLNLIANTDKYAAVIQAEQTLQGSFPVSKFIAYFQLHQFESLVFTQPEVLLKEFPKAEKAIDQLKLQRSKYKNENPELINSTNKPSYRIEKALGVDELAFKGNVIGTLTAKIEIPTLRQACRHFNEWLTKLETLA